MSLHFSLTALIFSRPGVCVYGVGDLSWMLTQGHLFANKFDVDADVFAVACLDEWVFNRTKLQVVGR